MPRIQKQKHQRAKRGLVKRRKQKNSPQSNAIIKVPAPSEKPWELGLTEVEIVKNSICKGASDTELQYCLAVARRYKLDPLKQGQIWFISRWDKNAVNANGSRGANTWIPQVGINGLLHIAARDHKDYGSISEPEYGPMINHTVENKTFKAPEWCRVKAFKKGIKQPTIATIYFDEFCPDTWANAHLFWARMPRNQIAKCAKAQAVRQAYPDLGGLYIPEEMQRSAVDYTPDGRLIVDQHGFTPSGHPVTHEALSGGSHEAAQAVGQEKIKRLTETLESPTKPVATPAQAKSGKPVGKIEIDWVNGTDKPARLIGDITEVVQGLKDSFVFEWKDDFWWLLPGDVKEFVPICKAEGYEVFQIYPAKPQDSGKTQQRGGTKPDSQSGSGKASGVKKGDSSPEPILVTGTVDRIQTTQTANKAVMAYVTIVSSDRKKTSYGTFDKDIIDILSKVSGKPIVCQIFIKESGKYVNIVGLKSVGSTEYVDGKTPVIQQKSREAGGSLFK